MLVAHATTRLTRTNPRLGGRFGLQTKTDEKWVEQQQASGEPFRAKTRTSAMLKRLELENGSVASH